MDVYQMMGHQLITSGEEEEEEEEKDEEQEGKDKLTFVDTLKAHEVARLPVPA